MCRIVGNDFIQVLEKAIFQFFIKIIDIRIMCIKCRTVKISSFGQFTDGDVLNFLSTNNFDNASANAFSVFDAAILFFILQPPNQHNQGIVSVIRQFHRYLNIDNRHLVYYNISIAYQYLKNRRISDGISL